MDFAARRLGHWPKVSLIRQDSREFLKRLDLPKDRTVFFHLDAPWEGDLQEEIELIFATISEFPDNDRRLRTRRFRIWLRRLWTGENARFKKFSIS